MERDFFVGGAERNRKAPPAEWARQVWEGPSVNQQEPRDGDIGLLHWRPWICADPILCSQGEGTRFSGVEVYQPRLRRRRI